MATGTIIPIKSDVNYCPYAVGDIYITMNSILPSVRWPGTTWEAIEGKFLLSASDSYTAGDTGGEAEHTLSVEEMPSHKHSLAYRTSIISTGTAGTWYFDIGTAGTVYENSPSIGNTGGGQPHNNMPPYLAVYMWKRVE